MKDIVFTGRTKEGGFAPSRKIRWHWHWHWVRWAVAGGKEKPSAGLEV